MHCRYPTHSEMQPHLRQSIYLWKQQFHSCQLQFYCQHAMSTFKDRVNDSLVNSGNMLIPYQAKSSLAQSLSFLWMWLT